MWHNWRKFGRRPWAVIGLAIFLIVFFVTPLALTVAENAANFLWILAVPVVVIAAFWVMLVGRRH